MKKLLTLILAAALAVTLIACSNETEKKDDNKKDDKTETSETVKVKDVYELADALYASVPEENKPFLMTEILTADNFEWLSFIPYEEGLEGIVSQPMMGSIAHKVVIIKCQDETKAVEVAETLKTNADPRWLVCVEADDVRVATNENLAMLMLTTNELGMGDIVMDAFKNIDAASVNSISFEAPVFEDEGFVDEEFVGEEFADDAVIEDGEEVFAGEDNVVEIPAVDEKTDAVEIPTVDQSVDAPVVDVEAPEAEAPVETPVEAPVENEAPVDAETIYSIVDGFYASIPEDNKPFLMTQAVDSESFEWLTFIPYEEGLEAVVNMPMMGSIAHKVVIVKCKDNADAQRVAELLKSNANPRWLVCVEADDVRTATNGNLAMLMLTTNELGMGDTIFNAFNALDAATIASLPSFNAEPVVE